MRKVSKSQFLDVVSCCRKIGCIVDVDIKTGKGRLMSEEELRTAADSSVGIRMRESVWFRTYEMIYKRELEQRKAKVVLEV